MCACVHLCGEVAHFDGILKRSVCIQKCMYECMRWLVPQERGRGGIAGPSVVEPHHRRLLELRLNRRCLGALRAGSLLDGATTVAVEEEEEVVAVVAGMSAARDSVLLSSDIGCKA